MASNDRASILLFLSLNLFLLVSSHDVNYNSDGSPSSTNSGNPVVIHPGNVLPNGNNTPGQSGTCNPLNLGVCLNLLGLVDVELGNVPTKPCCSLIEGLLDLEAAVCLCTAVRANVLGININLPISLSLLLSNCGREVATEYICSSDNTDNNSKGSSSATQSTNTTDNNSKGSSTTNSPNPENNSSKGSSSTTNSPNSENNNSNGSSSTTNSENPKNNSSEGSSSTTNSPNSENNNSNGSSSTTNSANPKNNSSKGSSSITNPTNPIVIRPGDVLPSGSNKQSQNGTCNPLNLGVCVNLLGLVDIELGDVPTEPCCSVIEGLLDLEAAVCLCTAVRANVLGINIDLPISLSLLLNNCGRDVATEYICGS